MLVHFTLAALALLSLALTVWQWLAARRFPLHRRATDVAFAPGVTLLKPLKGCDAETCACLASWFAQEYRGPVQLLFGVAAADDPVCAVVRDLLAQFPQANAQLVVCAEQFGPNAKVSTLAHLERLAQHEHCIISDADTRVPPDFLAQVIQPLRDPQVGVVNCFYALANPTTLAMQWEAVAVNADFWSQVLQARTLRPQDFALGAVMATRRAQLAEIGGFRALVDYLADDYQLGNQLARRGYRIELCPVVVECWERPQGWREVWAHQLRWARTVRVCQPGPYFLSILSNATIWPVLWLAIITISLRFNALGIGELHSLATMWVVKSRSRELAELCLVALQLLGFTALLRALMSINLASRLTRGEPEFDIYGAAALKDLLQVAVWTMAFLGDTVEWRGQRLRVQRGGKLVPLPERPA